ncbi:hypothetical protein CK203_083233 [Vitis vinifera]|uniref:Uncharacterized protein n=1 Tax=Vitis vinifera TaxID=29760 RepID=A0A438D424_VITVI|nr:hypothetical protein CK203_083233 [Vitis vinifera]
MGSEMNLHKFSSSEHSNPNSLTTAAASAQPAAILPKLNWPPLLGKPPLLHRGIVIQR